MRFFQSLHEVEPEQLSELAIHAEDLGFEGVTFGDHLVKPASYANDYLYSEDGRPPWDPENLDDWTPPYVDAWVASAALGHVTSRLRFLPYVYVLPMRQPVHVAKQLATADLFAPGRMILGVGAGWLKEEFEALDTPDFDKRGAVTDEWLTIFKQLWTQSPASFTGQFYDYKDIRAEPLPLQKPHPPIWVGGHSRAALRRTAKHGNGWHPVGAIAASPLPPDEMRTHLATLKQMTEAEGRDFGVLTISYKAPLYDNAVPDRDGTRRSFSGTPEQIAADIRSFAAIGVHELIFDFRGESTAASIERLQRFAAEVMPLVK